MGISKTLNRQGELEERRKLTIPSYVVTLAGGAILIAIPLLARHLDRTADEFDQAHFVSWPACGWVTCAALGAIVFTRRLQIWFAIEEGSLLAVAYDGLPLLLSFAWIVLVASLISAHWLLAFTAGALCIEHLALIIPRLVRSKSPDWTRRATTIDVVVANVYIDNQTPGLAAQQLIATDGEIIVLIEATPDFMATFDQAGGLRTHPYRVWDPQDDSDYAVVLASKTPLGPRTLMTRLGPLRLAVAEIEVDGTKVLVVALNPMAMVDPGGHVTWKEQIEVLKSFIPTLDGPLIIAGDLNTTRYRPEFEELLSLGLTDAVDSLGKGLNPSFKLSANGALAKLGAVVRLDHALVNNGMHPKAMRNLDPCGSDHLPFVLTVAIRPTNGSRRKFKRTLRGTASVGR